MKRELLKGMSTQYIRQAYDAYITLRGLYEDFCSGPRGAMQYREYFGICDSLEAITRELNERARSYGGGE